VIGKIVQVGYQKVVIFTPNQDRDIKQEYTLQNQRKQKKPEQWNNCKTGRNFEHCETKSFVHAGFNLKSHPKCFHP